MSGEETAADGPATNLLRSATRLGGTLLEVVHTRVELLTTEISEDVERGVRSLLWGLVAVLAAVMGLLLAGITLIIYYWDTHRMARGNRRDGGVRGPLGACSVGGESAPA